MLQGNSTPVWGSRSQTLKGWNSHGGNSMTLCCALRSVSAKDVALLPVFLLPCIHFLDPFGWCIWKILLSLSFLFYDQSISSDPYSTHLLSSSWDVTNTTWNTLIVYHDLVRLCYLDRQASLWVKPDKLCFLIFFTNYSLAFLLDPVTPL